MKKHRKLFLLMVFLATQGFGQNTESMPEIGLVTIAQVNQGNSYITFPTDIGNIEPLWFEANLKPNFYIRQSKNSRLMGVLTPQVIIRMYQEESFPVRTPSYIPQITVFYLLNRETDSRNLSLFGRVAHHSNGQDGDFHREDGGLNLKTGNFATNFLEMGLIGTNVNTRFSAYQFFKTSIEIHPEGFVQEELRGIYSCFRWHNAFSIFKLAPVNHSGKRNKPAISLKSEMSWMFGDYDKLDGLSPERLNLSVTFYYHPKLMEDIGLFIQYYHGSDYYNIYFHHRLDVIRFGLMTEKLRF